MHVQQSTTRGGGGGEEESARMSHMIWLSETEKEKLNKKTVLGGHLVTPHRSRPPKDIEEPVPLVLEENLRCVGPCLWRL